MARKREVVFLRRGGGDTQMHTMNKLLKCKGELLSKANYFWKMGGCPKLEAIRDIKVLKSGSSG